MYRDRIDEHGGSKVAAVAMSGSGELLDIAPDDAAELDRAGGEPPGPGGSPSAPEVLAEVAGLRREVSELRRANKILKTASAFSRRRRSTTDCHQAARTHLGRRPERGIRRSRLHTVYAANKRLYGARTICGGDVRQ
jgi:hypothetical protein